MIPWTTHIDCLGFKYETCKYGGLFICWHCGNFSIGYCRNPKIPE